MTSSFRKCTCEAHVGCSSAWTRTGEGGLPICRAAQRRAWPCSTQLCYTASPKATDCVPALHEDSAWASSALAEQTVYRAVRSMSATLNLLSAGQCRTAGKHATAATCVHPGAQAWPVVPD